MKLTNNRYDILFICITSIAILILCGLIIAILKSPSTINPHQYYNNKLPTGAQVIAVYSTPEYPNDTDWVEWTFKSNCYLSHINHDGEVNTVSCNK